MVLRRLSLARDMALFKLEGPLGYSDTRQGLKETFLMLAREIQGPAGQQTTDVQGRLGKRQ